MSYVIIFPNSLSEDFERVSGSPIIVYDATAFKKWITFKLKIVSKVISNQFLWFPLRGRDGASGWLLFNNSLYDSAALPASTFSFKLKIVCKELHMMYGQFSSSKVLYSDQWILGQINVLLSWY